MNESIHKFLNNKNIKKKKNTFLIYLIHISVIIQYYFNFLKNSRNKY